MHLQQAKYELLNEKHNLRQRHTCIQICLLFTLCAMSSVIVYATWTIIYRKHYIYPPKLLDIPDLWVLRARKHSQAYSNNNLNLKKAFSNESSIIYLDKIKRIENEEIYPSKLGNYIYSEQNSLDNKKLVCYYDAPTRFNLTNYLYPLDIDPFLCTHINVGIVNLNNFTLQITPILQEYFKNFSLLKKKNPDLKILLWIGGVESSGFSEMVLNHANRKLFIQSLKSVLEMYRLDGVDIDWEFPSAFHKERMHFSQLLHEIRREYQREHRTYLLSVAVAAAESISDYSYDVREINSYADYVNIMTYDFHFYSKETPMTGLNSPLFKRHDEYGIFGTLNINFTVNYWINKGLDKNKIVLGLPTYGHSFKLVNPFNTGLYSPAEGYGDAGNQGFVSFSDVCRFRQNNIYVTLVYDVETCSPYLFAGTEWISYENEKSVECKANYIKENGLGGAMVFSLNTDDYGSYCHNTVRQRDSNIKNFPLITIIKSILMKV